MRPLAPAISQIFKLEFFQTSFAISKPLRVTSALHGSVYIFSKFIVVVATIWEVNNFFFQWLESFFARTVVYCFYDVHNTRLVH